MPRCVHCLNPVAGTTRDHAPPKSWYPLSERVGKQLATAPSCSDCNGTLGKIERELTETIGLALAGKKTAGARHVSRAAIRAHSEASGRDPADSRIRENKRQNLMADLVPGDQADSPQIMRRPDGSTVAAKLRSSHLHAFGEKMVRVLTHYKFGEFIESPKQVVVRPVLLEGFERFEAMIMIQNERISVLRHLPETQTYYWDTQWGARAWALNLWGELRFIVLAGTPDELGKVPVGEGDVLSEHLDALDRPKN